MVLPKLREAVRLPCCLPPYKFLKYELVAPTFILSLILSLVNNSWSFVDDPTRSQSFLPDVNNQLTAPSFQIPLGGLREYKSVTLSPAQKSALDLLLSRNGDIFGKGGVVLSHFATHHIRAQNNEPKSTPRYLLNGPKKAFLKKGAAFFLMMPKLKFVILWTRTTVRLRRTISRKEILSYSGLTC